MGNVVQDNSPQIKPADAWSRIWANVIDGFIVGIPAILVYYFIITPLIVSDKITEVNNLQIKYIFIFIVYFIYFIYLNVNKGATWGKVAYSLKVVKYKTEQYINYKSAIVRELVKGLYFVYAINNPLIYFIGIATVIIDSFLVLCTVEKRTIHDRIANTQVIKTNNSLSTRRKLNKLFLIILIPIVLFSIIILNLILRFPNIQNDLADNLTIKKLYASKTFVAKENNSRRRNDVFLILNDIKQYMTDNNGAIPSTITTTEREISKSEVDLCSYLIPKYTSVLPKESTKDSPSQSFADCNESYKTGYTIFRNPSTNKITVRAPNAELEEEIEVTR